MTEDVKNAVEGMAKAFEEFKATNESRIAELEKKGSTDPIVEEKLKNIEADLDRYEEINQKLTLATESAKKTEEKLAEMETVLKRPEAGIESKEIDYRVESFGNYLRKGENNLQPDEIKALTVGDNTQAGFLAPPEYVNELIKTLTEISPMRQIARVRATNQKSVQIPSRTETFSAQFVGEVGTRTETTGYTVQMEEIPTHEAYAQVNISEQMLEDSVFNLEAEIQGEFADRFALLEGTSMITGNGVGKPEGLLTNTSVLTTNSGNSSALTADGLIDLAHAVKTPYSTNGTFVFNRTTLSAIRKLKDGNGQYIFQAGMMLTSGVPNTILGYPYVEMPDMPDVASSAKPVAFGDFSRGYMIVDRVALSVLRDPFTQVSTGIIRYVARRRFGGQVILPEALRTQTIA